MKQYLELLQEIKDNGRDKGAARDGMPTHRSRHGHISRYDLNDGFPLVTTKEVNFNQIVVELLWFLRGDTNVKFLIDNGCNIWNQDAYNYYVKKYEANDKGQAVQDKYSNPDGSMYSYKEFVSVLKSSAQIYSEGGYAIGNCGYQYGKVWRDWDGAPNVDQIARLIGNLQKSPASRRHLVTAVDPAHDDDLALYWCHALFQFHTTPLTSEERSLLVSDSNVYSHEELDQEFGNVPKYRLDCQLYQRSCDVFLGVPYNIASYALIVHMIAEICGMVVGEFIHTYGDVHIYTNHKDQVDEQLTREPYPMPKLEISTEGIYLLVHIGNRPQNLDGWWDLKPEHFTLKDYKSHDKIKGKLSTGLK